MILSSEYQTNNIRLIRQIINHKVKYITRLSKLKPEDELRLEFGSLLLETYGETRLYMDVDEGLGNILLFDASDKYANINRKIEEFSYHSRIYPENKTHSILNSFFLHPICGVDIISRADETGSLFTMCGFKLSFFDSKFLYLGSYLTDLRLPEPYILFPEEVEDNLIHQPLPDISE